MDNWTRYYKLDEMGNPCITQMSYEPLLNPERNVLCMNFDPTNTYQDFMNTVGFIPEIVYELFDREVAYINKFQKYAWAPEVLEVVDNKIFIRWYDNTCNDIINTGGELPSDWKEQLHTILQDQLNESVYKITQYPHCFYVNNGRLHTIDLHACFSFDDCLVPYSKIKGMIHKTTEHRIAEALDNDLVDMREMFLNSLRTHIKWPDNQLQIIYDKLEINH
jgi:hypothetical protein